MWGCRDAWQPGGPASPEHRMGEREPRTSTQAHWHLPATAAMPTGPPSPAPTVCMFPCCWELWGCVPLPGLSQAVPLASGCGSELPAAILGWGWGCQSGQVAGLWPLPWVFWGALDIPHLLWLSWPPSGKWSVGSIWGQKATSRTILGVLGGRAWPEGQ